MSTYNQNYLLFSPYNTFNYRYDNKYYKNKYWNKYYTNRHGYYDYHPYHYDQLLLDDLYDPYYFNYYNTNSIHPIPIYNWKYFDLYKKN